MVIEVLFVHGISGYSEENSLSGNSQLVETMKSMCAYLGRDAVSITHNTLLEPCSYCDNVDNKVNEYIAESVKCSDISSCKNNILREIKSKFKHIEEVVFEQILKLTKPTYFLENGYKHLCRSPSYKCNGMNLSQAHCLKTSSTAERIEVGRDEKNKLPWLSYDNNRYGLTYEQISEIDFSANDDSYLPGGAGEELCMLDIAALGERLDINGKVLRHIIIVDCPLLGSCSAYLKAMFCSDKGFLFDVLENNNDAKFELLNCCFGRNLFSQFSALLVTTDSHKAENNMFGGYSNERKLKNRQLFSPKQNGSKSIVYDHASCALANIYKGANNSSFYEDLKKVYKKVYILDNTTYNDLYNIYSINAILFQCIKELLLSNNQFIKLSGNEQPFVSLACIGLVFCDDICICKGCRFLRKEMHKSEKWRDLDHSEVELLKPYIESFLIEK